MMVSKRIVTSSCLTLYSVYIFFTSLITTSFEINPTGLKQECCSLGEASGRNDTQDLCRDLFYQKVPRSYLWSPDCKNSFEACCQQEQEAKACTVAIRSVKKNSSMSCYASDPNERVNDGHSKRYWTAYEDCCSGCQAGMDTANKTSSCQKTTFLGALYDATFQQCCEETISMSIFMRSTDRCKTDINRCQQNCIDPGPTLSIRCLCRIGYELSDDGLSCIDDNECNMNPDICGNEECVNTLGSFYCRPRNSDSSWGRDRVVPRKSVYETYEYVTNAMTSTTPSSRQTVELSCSLGKMLDPQDPESCVDIDECAEGTDNCPDHAPICENTVGSYICHTIEEETEIPRQSSPDSTYRTGDPVSQPTFTSNVPEICTKGYTNIQGKCVDIDECGIGQHRCNITFERCNNVVGSYRCIPYELDIDNSKKMGQTDFFTAPYAVRYPEVSPTSTSTTEATPRLIAIPSEDQYRGHHHTPSSPSVPRHPSHQTISCKPGYEAVNGICRDINECAFDPTLCSEGLRCDNTQGSYQCVRIGTCGTGWTWNADLGQCQDIDECSLVPSRCLSFEECINTNGSFTCRLKTCPEGQFLSGGYCWVTECGEGLRWDSLTHNCVDINECEVKRGIQPPCELNEDCINTPGSFRCQRKITCSPGYYFDRSIEHCRDIDECARGTHTCNESMSCINTEGSYECGCPPGYKYVNRNCEDIDECEMGTVCPHPSIGHCVNIVGSFYCLCSQGYRQNSSSPNLCDDIDECKEGSHDCDQDCVNAVGGFECRCQPGYEAGRFRSITGKEVCHDINECERDRQQRLQDPNHPKLCEGSCRNFDGGYQCSCPEGYHLNAVNKKTCDDIDECSLNKTQCPEDNVCLNTRGGYKCFEIRCPDGYQDDPSAANRCRRKERCNEKFPDEGSEELKSCLEEPTIYTFNYLTIPANMKLSEQTGKLSLFTLSGERSHDKRYIYSMKFLKSTQDKEGVTPVDDRYFDLVTDYFGSEMFIVRPIEGPQTIELEITVKIYFNGELASTMASIVYIHVSEFEY